MTAILSPEHYHWWLEPKRFEPEFLTTLLRPYPAEDMEFCRVSKLVNSAKNDGPECIAPGQGDLASANGYGAQIKTLRSIDFPTRIYMLAACT